jgi:hypothetical protein
MFCFLTELDLGSVLREALKNRVPPPVGSLRRCSCPVGVELSWVDLVPGGEEEPRGPPSLPSPSPDQHSPRHEKPGVSTVAGANSIVCGGRAGAERHGPTIPAAHCHNTVLAGPTTSGSHTSTSSAAIFVHFYHCVADVNSS